MVGRSNHVMRCMDVRGGCEPASERIELDGLDAFVEATPFGDCGSGGDIYYVSSCATGRITRLLLADVSGHGSAVAEVARSLRDLMRAHVNQIEQRRFVARMNDDFAQLSRRGTFATALAMTFFEPTGELSIVNAGHPPPLLFRAQTNRWTVLDADAAEPGAAPVRNVPLGITGGQMFDELHVVLTEGDRVFGYTDALVEASDGETGRPIGVEGLLRLVESSGATGGEGEAALEALMAAFETRLGASLADDDLTLMLLCARPGVRRATVFDGLLAPFRALGGFLRWRGEGTRGLPVPEPSLKNMGGAILPPLGKIGRRD